MHDVGIRCVDLGHVAFPTALRLYFRRFHVLVLSIEIRACCHALCSWHHWQESGFVVMICKIEVASDFSVTRQRISISWGIRELLRCSRRAPSRRPTVADGCLHRRLEPNFRFGRYHCRSNSSVHPLQIDLPRKISLSSPIMPGSRAFSNVRKRTFPMSDYM